jgi:carboxypeptidase Taq
MNQKQQKAYVDLIKRCKEWNLIASCGELLGWDERTYMPLSGSAHRAEQMALLARLGHERLASAETGECLAIIENDTQSLGNDEAANVREISRIYQRCVRIPRDLIAEIARVATRGQAVWQESRERNDFPEFLPWLDKMIRLKREQADAIGYRESRYDALLEEFEPSATTKDVSSIFASLRAELAPMVKAIASSSRHPRREILEREYDPKNQEAFGREVATAIGFDFSSGRLDVTAHPFCSGIGPGDCRLTTRYDRRSFSKALFGTLHEAGHGIYEQGLPPTHVGTPVGMPTSLGIHESQSRTWENFVGRSKAFWQHFFQKARAYFTQVLGDVDLDEFVFAINEVRPSFIRIEADEVTYNMHIILRFELEQDLLTGNLQAGDVPAAWNEKFAKSFELTPPDNSTGCLQDVHWSAGLFGYFPTYALGNMYAAQFMAQARRDVNGLDADFRKGDFKRLKNWLNTRIHAHGQRFRATELCRHVTGQPLSYEPLVTYLRDKFEPLYNLR